MKKECDFGTLEIIGDDVLLVNYTNIKVINVNTLLEVSQFRKAHFSGESKYYAISQLSSGIVTFSKEAKEWLAQHQEFTKIRHLDIIILTNWASKMEAKLYLKLDKPKVLTKIAGSLEEALQLIQEHRKAKNQ